MRKLIVSAAVVLASFVFTGCETTSAASGVAAIAPAAKTVARVCDVAETWIGYVQKGVGVIGDAAEKIAVATGGTNTTTTATVIATE